MLSWLLDLLAPLIEAALYVVVIVALASRIGGAARNKIVPAKQGGGGGPGVLGHLAVAAIVGTFRLAGQLTRAILVGFFRHVAPAIGRGLSQAASLVARASAGRSTRTQQPRAGIRRRRLPRVSFEWPHRSGKTLRHRYPADEFEDEWRRANGWDDFD